MEIQLLSQPFLLLSLMSFRDRFQNTKIALQTAYRGVRFVGLGNAARTVLYRPRYARWVQRYGKPQGPEMPFRPGAMMEVEATPDGLLVTWERAKGAIHVVSSHILRVRVVPGHDLPPYFSYATIPQQESIPWQWERTPTGVRVSIPGGSLTLRGDPFGLAWEDASGHGFTQDTTFFYWEAEGVQWGQQFPEEIWWYGLGERAFHLALERRTYHLTTRDPEGYGPGDDPLYINIPFLMGVHQGRAFGLLLDRMSDGHLTLREDGGVEYGVLGEEIRWDIIFGPEPQQVVSRLADLTGHAPMVPRWVLGYHQSRWSYENEKVVREIAREFRRRRIPCDAIHFDIDYMDGFRCFTWDKKAFPDLPGLMADLHGAGFKAVGMIDPGIKVDKRYEVCADGVEKGMFCRLPDGTMFHGPVWPGECYFPDFTHPDVRAWWGKWYRRLLEVGFDGFWNDMNEPTIFGGATFPPRVQHHLEGQGAEHWEVHSAYGMQMARATKEGLDTLRPRRRNWVFTRSAYAGTQRYASSWTGDNRSTWADLRITPSMLMNLGLSGLSMTGSDVGGFEGSPSPELYARWISSAAFHPFFRTHTAKGTPWQEPWRYGDEVEAISRKFIQWRYRLLPAIYTLYWQYASQGIPMMRPLFFEDPSDEALLVIDDQWLFGDHLLVAPALEAGMTAREIYLPQGTWFDFWSDEIYEGPRVILQETPLDHVPLFVRAGAVLPLGPVQQFTDEDPTAPLELHVYPGQATSWLYEDDGDSMAYEQGDFRLTRFQVKQEGDILRIEREVTGSWTPSRPVSLIVHTPSLQRVFLDDIPQSVLNNRLNLDADTWQKVEAILT